MPHLSVVSGSGLANVTVGKTAELEIISKDIYGGYSNITTDGYQIELKPSDGSTDGSLYFTATHLYNGTYEASYIPTKSGNFTLSITLKDAHIQGSPLSLNVKPGHIDHSYSEVISGLDSTDPEVREAGDTIMLTVQAKDLYGNNMT